MLIVHSIAATAVNITVGFWRLWLTCMRHLGFCTARGMKKKKKPTPLKTNGSYTSWLFNGNVRRVILVSIVVDLRTILGTLAIRQEYILNGTLVLLKALCKFFFSIVCEHGEPRGTRDIGRKCEYMKHTLHTVTQALEWTRDLRTVSWQRLPIAPHVLPYFNAYIGEIHWEQSATLL